MKKLQIAEKKEEVIKDRTDHYKVVPDDEKKLLRNLSKKRRNSNQGKFSSSYGV